MSTPTTHRPVSLAPSPWLGWMLVVLAVLAAAWLVVTVVDVGERDTAGPQAAVQQRDAQAGTHESTRRAGRTGIAPAGADAAAHAASTARLTGEAEGYSPAAQAAVPAPAPSDIFDYRDLNLLAGSVSPTVAASPTPSDIFDYRQFDFIAGSGLGVTTAEQLAAYDLVSGDIPAIVPFHQQQVADQLGAYDLVSGDIPAIVPFGQPGQTELGDKSEQQAAQGAGAATPPANPKQEIH